MRTLLTILTTILLASSSGCQTSTRPVQVRTVSLEQAGKTDAVLRIQEVRKPFGGKRAIFASGKDGTISITGFVKTFSVIAVTSEGEISEYRRYWDRTVEITAIDLSIPAISDGPGCSILNPAKPTELLIDRKSPFASCDPLLIEKWNQYVGRAIERAQKGEQKLSESTPL